MTLRWRGKVLSFRETDLFNAIKGFEAVAHSGAPLDSAQVPNHIETINGLSANKQCVIFRMPVWWDRTSFERRPVVVRLVGLAAIATSPGEVAVANGNAAEARAVPYKTMLTKDPT
ncbi:uncharacterized protein N7479_007828 [Penicillium vulpinum]|uniref:uncharacterized protein n=1 Tax=Penicillium vulpinum TaxID=29845 RepID=UPI0025486DF6|nr:uncharacterized protein N7479_007828 [Penicillium vulpinum]KAJ5960678.1 hypothetical protein N7479_007828 [Penicillium vulpinum]